MAQPRFTPFQLGNFNVLQELGAGGMAEVFLAEPRGGRGFGRPVTIKRIQAGMRQNPSYAEMFVDEANIMAALDHPNVVKVMELRHAPDCLYMVLEFVDGTDLERLQAALFKQAATLPVPLSLHIVTSLLRALGCAHAARNPAGEPLHLIHRDVAPGNLLLSRHGHIKLADFGIAKAVGRLTNTAAGVVKGRFSYMAPEIMAGYPFDQRSDLFSAGVLLWELLAGRRLFTAKTDMELMRAVVSMPIQAPSSVNPAVPPGVDALVLKALRRKPEERFANAREFLVAALAQQGMMPVDDLAAALATWTERFVPLRDPKEFARLARPEGESPSSWSPAAAQQTTTNSMQGAFEVVPSTVAMDPSPPEEPTLQREAVQDPWDNVGTALETEHVHSVAGTAHQGAAQSARVEWVTPQGVRQVEPDALWRTLSKAPFHVEGTLLFAGAAAIPVDELVGLLMLDRVDNPVQDTTAVLLCNTSNPEDVRRVLHNLAQEKATGVLACAGDQPAEQVRVHISQGLVHHVYGLAMAPHLLDVLLDRQPAGSLERVVARVFQTRRPAWQAVLELGLLTGPQLQKVMQRFSLERLQRVLAWQRWRCWMAAAPAGQVPLPTTSLPLSSPALVG